MIINDNGLIQIEINPEAYELLKKEAFEFSSDFSEIIIGLFRTNYLLMEELETLCARISKDEK